jgi:transcriptional regulator
MYNSDPFRETDGAKLRAFIREHPFATLVSAADAGPFVSHIPLYLDTGGESLVGHVARGNGHWRLSGAKSLAIFHGPHAYISASWYDAPGVVPTWNYLAVHVRGSLAVLTAPELGAVLDRMIAEHEPDPEAFQANLGEASRAGLERGIVGIRLSIESWEGKWKLSQNKDSETRERLSARLAEGTGEDAQKIARMMRESVERESGNRKSDGRESDGRESGGGESDRP